MKYVPWPRSFVENNVHNAITYAKNSLEKRHEDADAIVDHITLEVLVSIAELWAADIKKVGEGEG
jgi:hypothetical protein